MPSLNQCLAGCQVIYTVRIEIKKGMIFLLLPNYLLYLTYLKRMSFVSFIDGGQHRFVDPEAEGGGDEGERQVANHTAHNVHLI